MGVLHTIAMLFAIIGIRSGESSGLEDIAIDSNVVEEGSLDRLLNGKLFYEVCIKMVWEGFMKHRFHKTTNISQF